MSSSLAEATKRSPVTATLTELLADDIVWHVRGIGSLSGDYQGRDQVFGFFGRIAEETGGTFRLDIHDILANDEHTVSLATLAATRGGKSIEVPVANVTHNRDGQITEFWSAVTDPRGGSQLLGLTRPPAEPDRPGTRQWFASRRRPQ